MLLALETVRRARDVRGYPGWRLHKLRGNRRGFWAASVSANERLVFRFQDGRACDVELTDYH